MSNPVPPSRRAETGRFAPQDWSLRVKFAVVLLVPGILVVILGGLRIADQTGQAAELDRVARYASVQGEIATLVTRLQQERYLSTAFVAGNRVGDVAAVQTAFAGVDATRENTRPAVEGLSDGNPDLVAAHGQAAQALARLPQLRHLVLQSSAPPAAALSSYSELIAQVGQLNDTVLRGVDTTEANGLAIGLAGLAVVRNETSLQLALVTAAASSTEAPAVSLAELPASDVRLGTGLDDFRASLDAGQRVRFGSLIAGAANIDRARLVQGLVAGSGTGALPDGTLARAETVYDTVLAEIDGAESGMRDELVTTSAARGQTAVGLAWANAVLLLVALLIGATVVGLIVRGMISSLRTLRRSALEVADKRLPDAVRRMRSGSAPDTEVEPVPVDTSEEVGQVARAFDAVHAQAVRLAAEQATLQNTVNIMFVNLSRRSQSLVDRQLQLIEEMAGNGQDLDQQLSSLLRLDHLATRMRRNSENLLVLAGADLAKRSVHQVPVVDVLQAAVSQVEQYERVTVEPPPPVSVLGHAAVDLRRLLAELLDNATSFSPPDTQVTMTSARTPDGPLVVEINDRGVGMRPDELGETNRRLGCPDAATVTASRRMGLFVIGRLAARHGVQVCLVPGSGVAQPRAQRGSTSVAVADAPGLTARVTIPANLVGGAPVSPTVSPSRRVGEGEWFRAAAAPAGSAAAEDGRHRGRPPIFPQVASGRSRSYRQVRINRYPNGVVPAEESAAFATVADDGWRAVVEAREDIQANTPEVAGLPRRTPGARLLPGSIRGGAAGGPAPNADAVRSRLTDYQRGVRKGRGHRTRAEPDAAVDQRHADDRTR